MPFRRPPSLPGRIGGLLLLAGIFAFGAYTLTWHVAELRAYHGSLAWRETRGTILSSSVVSRAKGGVCTCIRYRYRVGDTSLENNRIRFGMDDQDREAAEKTVARFAKGRTVPVFFDPTMPDRAVLERSIQPVGVWLGAALGSLMIAFAIFLLFFWRRNGQI